VSARSTHTASAFKFALGLVLAMNVRLRQSSSIIRTRKIGTCDRRLRQPQTRNSDCIIARFWPRACFESNQGRKKCKQASKSVKENRCGARTGNNAR
jgi:hypothetical protein